MKVHLINFSPGKFMVQLENFRSLKISYFKESIAMDNFFLSVSPACYIDVQKKID